MTKAGKMHYLPAALIGQFADAAPESGRSVPAAARDRRVWVARRGVAKPFVTAAAKVGVDPDNPQLYRGSTDNLDELWQRAERDHFAVQGLVGELIETGRVSAPRSPTSLCPTRRNC